ncbi:MAG: vitamin B12 dependent-methionine synthase activation domain-containing protein [Hespellia sp.]|nr:vitamin B12 dependent-methionine synthase activation domain-containing protein [Hespellia sp.]
MDKKTREAIRYLGYGKNAVDEKTLSLISKTFQSLESVAVKKSIYRIFNIVHEDENNFSIGKVHIHSRNLGKNLRGCNKIVLFGATLGAGVDLLMNRYNITDMAQAVIMQSCAAALLEEYCDECQDAIAAKLSLEQLYLRPRFSPGYGDFDISYQKPLMMILDCAKTIGLTMTDGYMMTPTKSVTAVIGISPSKEPCHKSGCEECTKKDCLYRRDSL